MKRKTNQSVPKGAVNKEIISLNDRLVSDFSIEELELRLETDPLMFSQVFGLSVSNSGDGDVEPLCVCRKLENCPELECGCRGIYEEPPICNPVCEFGVEI